MEIAMLRKELQWLMKLKLLEALKKLNKHKHLNRHFPTKIKSIIKVNVKRKSLIIPRFNNNK